MRHALSVGMPPSTYLLPTLLVSTLTLLGCASDHSSLGGEDSKEDVFGNAGKGESCTFNWQCSADDGLTCGASETCSNPNLGCEYYGNLIVNETKEERLVLTEKVTIHRGVLEITNNFQASTEIEQQLISFEPAQDSIISIKVSESNLAFEIFARDVDDDLWIPSWSSPNRGGENISVFQDVELDIVNERASYQGRNDCMAARNGSEPFWAFDRFAGKIADIGEKPVEFRVGVVPAIDLPVGSYPYEIQIEKLRE